MSSQEFICDMKKLFAICAISNLELKYADLASWTIVVTVFWRPHKSLCAQSVQMLASAFQLDVFSF